MTQLSCKHHNEQVEIPLLCTEHSTDRTFDWLDLKMLESTVPVLQSDSFSLSGR